MSSWYGKVFNWKMGVLASVAAVGIVASNTATASPTCPTPTPVESLWSSSDTPASASSTDPNSVDVGVSFQSAVAGQVLGVKFYKGASNTGTHIGYLWSSAGKLLSSVTFTNETATGWQEADFSTPVNIDSNTSYVVSYLAPNGHYAETQNYFTSSHSNGDLTAAKDSATTPDGVYSYTKGSFPKTSYKATNYWVDVVFTAVQTTTTPSPSPSTASPSPSASASSSPSSSPSQSPSSSPSSSPSASPSSTATVPSTGYVQPGSVGYLGDKNALTVYQPGGSAPSGCSWLSYGLRCDQTNLTLDHVWLKGSLYWTGTGTLKVTNSIAQGGTVDTWYVLLAHPSNTGSLPGSTIDVEDSTLGWDSSLGYVYPAGTDVAPAWSLYGNERMIMERDDVSGMPQGVDPTDSSIIKDNYFHNLFQNGTSSSPTHLDGIYSQGGGNIQIDGNYVDVPVRSDTTAAVFIQDRGSSDTGISITNNYLNGGAYILRNQTGINVDVENNVFGNGVWGDVGDLSGYPGTYGTWSGNVDTKGNVISKP